MYTFHASLTAIENENIMHSALVYYPETCDAEISQDHNENLSTSYFVVRYEMTYMTQRVLGLFGLSTRLIELKILIVAYKLNKPKSRSSLLSTYDFSGCKHFWFDQFFLLFYP